MLDPARTQYFNIPTISGSYHIRSATMSFLDQPPGPRF